MSVFALHLLALAAVIVGILTNTELMAAGVIATAATGTWLILGHMNRSNA